jgi:putative peptidoglycan lipid II flippase
MLSRMGAAEAALYTDEAQDGGDGPADGAGGDDGRTGLAKLWGRFSKSVTMGAAILGVLFVANAGATFLARKVMGHVFGGGPEQDALINALQITSFPVDVIVLGGIIGPFLPIYMGLKGEAQTAARDFARTVLTVSLLALAVAMGLLIVFAAQVSPLAAPGFEGAQRELHIGLIRAVALGQMVIAASMILSEILIAERRFVTYGLAEIARSAGLAFGALALAPFLGIYGAAVGFILGSFGHLGIRLIGISRTAFRPRPSFAIRTKGTGEFGLLMLPKMLSQILTGLFVIYFNNVASTLAPGSTTSVNYAQDFQSTAASVVGLSFALSAFSGLSAAAAAGDKRAFKRIFRTNLLIIAGLSVLACVALIALSGFISGLFRGGNFDETDASRMAIVLIILALSVPFESLVELFARAIFATHNTLEPTLAIAAGFVVGVITTMSLSAQGLIALPIGYVAFRAVHLLVLAIFLKPRMARIGGTSRWSRAIVRDRWGDLPGGRRKPMPAGQLAMLAVLLAALTGGTLYAGAQAISKTSLVGGAGTTPWARTNGTRPPVITADPSIGSIASASGPIQTAVTSAVPGPFSMDLYRKGDFVSEFKDTWCVPAAMQVSMNMMSLEPDTTRDTQARLFDLAVSIAGSSYGGTDPLGWTKGLESLGYGKFSILSTAKMEDAVHMLVKSIRLTQRPGGLIVWKGWHSWVVSGFTATADPAYSSNYKVLSLRITDVWYPRISRIWGKSRGPDADVPMNQLAKDYKPWDQAKVDPTRQGMYVFVMPEL